MKVPTDLVYIDEYGLVGSNFYWDNRVKHGLTEEDMTEAGLTSARVQVSKIIIPILISVDEEFKKKGMRLYIKEGYRSEALYNIVYKKRVEKHGKEVADSLLNLETMPHAQGLTVDVAPWDPKENKEIYMRRGEDGLPALFIGFYRDKKDEESERLQGLQNYVAEVMMNHGFRIGTKREYFHFDYKPDIPKNYD